MSTRRRILFGGALGAVLLSATALIPSEAFAAPSCPAGYLCLWDNNPSDLGKFAGNNSSWVPYGWYHRSDKQYNNGTSGMSVCIWNGTNYTGDGYYALFLPRGWAGAGKNFGGSNQWTWASKCP